MNRPFEQLRASETPLSSASGQASRREKTRLQARVIGAAQGDEALMAVERAGIYPGIFLQNNPPAGLYAGFGVGYWIYFFPPFSSSVGGRSWPLTGRSH